MAINGTEYRAWAALAERDELPAAAHRALVAGLVPSGKGRRSWPASDWQLKELKKVLPALLERVHEQDLRDQLLVAVGGSHAQELYFEGRLRAADLPGLVQAFGPSPMYLGELARLDEYREFVAGFLDRLRPGELLGIAHASDFSMIRDGQVPEPIPWLSEVVVDRVLGDLADDLERFSPELQKRPLDMMSSHPQGWPDSGLGGLFLDLCPERWPALVHDDRVGPVVRHLLLDHDVKNGIDDAVLAACLPALCLHEWAELTEPHVSQSMRLRHIARRVQRHPRLRELAADSLHEAAEDCVARGDLLTVREQRSPHTYITQLAKALAHTSRNTDLLRRLCELLLTLRRPIAVERADAIVPSTPRLLLSDDARVEALTELAANPALDAEHFAHLLSELHPVEVEYVRRFGEGLPEPVVQAVTDHLATVTDHDTVRLCSDDELADAADPQAVLQSWIDALGKLPLSSMHNFRIEDQVLQSQYATPEHVRQLSAATVMSYNSRAVAEEAILDVCGDDPARWERMQQWLAAGERRLTGTFGQFLTRFERAASRARPS